MTLKPLPFGLILACALTAFAQPAEASDLRWELKEGDQLYYAFTWNFQQKEDVGAMNFRDVKIRIYYTLSQKVTKVEDGVATIEATISSIAASVDPTMMGMPMGKMEYDSVKDQEGSMLRAIKEALNKTFTFKLSPDGKVSDVVGGQAIRDAVAVAAEASSKELAKKMNGGGAGGGMGGMMGPEMIGMLAARLTVAFDDMTLRSTLNVVNNVLPTEGTAAEGDKWRNDMVEQLPELGTVTFTAGYTHKGEAEGKIAIKMKPKGDVKLQKDETEGEHAAANKDLKNMKVKYTRAKGTATFGGGRLIESEVIQKIVSEGDLPPILAGQAKPGDKLDATFELTLRYEKQDGPPAK